MKKQALLLTLVGLMCSCAKYGTDTTLIHNLPMAKKVTQLDNSLVTRLGPDSLNKLAPYLSDASKEDIVLSPATFSLAVAALSAVSTNFNNEAFKISDAKNDVKTMLESWNYEYKNDDPHSKNYSYFRSAVLHQQVGERYAFDQAKCEKISKENYVSTMVSKKDTYRSDADTFFSKEIGLNLKVPDLDMGDDGVVTYGVLKMKDYVTDGLGSVKNNFKFKTGESQVDTDAFGSENYPDHVNYYADTNYSAFEVKINYTNLLIVLPNEGVDINSINVSDAFNKYTLNKSYVPAYGYIPYFHNKTEGLNLSNIFSGVETGREVYMSELLKDDVDNNLIISKVMQSNDFEFNRYGVSGESITAIATCGAAAPDQSTPIKLNVDRPFYAISLKDNFPIFVSKVSNPGK